MNSQGVGGLFEEARATSITQRVRAAIENTRRVIPDYFWKMLKKRSQVEGGVGSVYPATAEELERELLSRSWYLYEHNKIAAGCTGGFTRMPGLLGIVELSSLPVTSKFTLRDIKDTGSCELVVEGSTVPRREVGFTVIMLGKHGQDEVVFTFHPGDPITPSQVKGDMDGKIITYEEARRLGFTYVQVA